VERFVEKPDRQAAERMCAEGYLWNSGIFVWRAARFLEEIRAHTPEVAAALSAFPDRNQFFDEVKSISVDVGVMERSSRVLVIPGEFGWDDVGTWSALSRVLPHDSSGNSSRGEASFVRSHENVVYSPNSHVVMFGVDGLVLVNWGGITLVTTTDLASDLNSLLEALPAEIKNK
jgi:mannose-1-phosphate guanylyltransferase